jgi:hypothetical protein
MTEQGFRVLKDIIRPDERGRITLGNFAKSKTYKVMINDAGQILLNPVVTVPEPELWLWQNSSALAAVGRGLEQVAKQETYDLGSFAQYADLEVED